MGLIAAHCLGSKPDFHGALGGDDARPLYDLFYRKVQEGYDANKVKNGVFQAMMQVALVNDGPVGSSDSLSELEMLIWNFSGHSRGLHWPTAWKPEAEQGQGAQGTQATQSVCTKANACNRIIENPHIQEDDMMDHKDTNQRAAVLLRVMSYLLRICMTLNLGMFNTLGYTLLASRAPEAACERPTG